MFTSRHAENTQFEDDFNGAVGPVLNILKQQIMHF